MRPPRHFCSTLLLTLFVLTAGVARGADVLEEVPGDALGFVILHNLAEVDAKVERLGSALNRDLPQPLGFLKDFTGVGDGLDPHGDFLLALVPAVDEHDAQPKFCVWLPVADYDQLINSVGAAPGEGIAAVTIAGEDLLVARRGDWALVMDPDDRSRMTKMLAAPSSPPPQVAVWKQWIKQNDITIVAFSMGVHQIRRWLEGGASGVGPKSATDSDDLFGSADDDNPQDSFAAARGRRTPRGIAGELQSELQKWAAASPELVSAIDKAAAIGSSIRLDAAGNAIVDLRVVLNKQLASPSAAKTASDLPPTLYDGGGFVVNAAGRIPRHAMSIMASAYVRRVVADIQTEDRTKLDEAAVRLLQQAAAVAAGDIRSANMLTQPGDQSQPVYVNDFAVLRVSSSTEFIGHANEVMRLWNKANRDAQGDTKLIFDVEDVKFGGRTATQYSVDMAAMTDLPVVPEVRQVMEKLFGPGGKLRLWIVPADDATVLLAVATPEQVATALKMLDRKRPVDWGTKKISEVNHLLPADADWRLFFNPHDYYQWLRRQTDALVGVPVIGGPLVKDFPASPPLGVAGGIRGSELWIEAAAPAETIKGAGVFVAKKK